MTDSPWANLQAAQLDEDGADVGRRLRRVRDQRLVERAPRDAEDVAELLGVGEPQGDAHHDLG